eukprot:15355772-Ditylum_brightwellii.AAC.1
MALPDQGTFIIEDTTFGDGVMLEANHHCNVGTTGVLCMPQGMNFQQHNANQNHGGIFTLSPTAIVDITHGQANMDEMIFPS